MALKSHFLSDLEKEKMLFPLLDRYYKKHLRLYRFKRVTNPAEQRLGVDLIFTHKQRDELYYIDEKAQLDYINEDLPTFAFELFYHRHKKDRLGWLLDGSKKTMFYSLVTGIYGDEPRKFTSCKITLVNRRKLLLFLNGRGMNESWFASLRKSHLGTHGKICVPELFNQTEGYLYHSKKNKEESPFNLILRLDFLSEMGLAKRLV